MPRLPLVLGGSGDLTPSNNTRFKGAIDFTATDRTGRYIRYGVREHAMAAIMNGIAVSDVLIPYGATFFCFTDYMRPAIRLAALSKYPIIFEFTHDSIGLGEDGPTHQAVEQIAALRAMPGLVVLRPSDATETAFAWKFALETGKTSDGPRTDATENSGNRSNTICICRKPLSRCICPCRAADPQIILMGTGSEVAICLDAYEKLSADGVRVRVVSLPSWELFEAQPEAYRRDVLPPAVTARVAVEAAVRLGWERYLGSRGEFIGMSGFGASAPVDAVYRGFGITAEAVINAARKVLE